MLSTIILARDEEKNIERAISSVKFSDEIVVIDDESTDKTAQIAEKVGAKVFKQKHLDDFSIARNNAMRRAKGDWILFIDADEIVPKTLAKEILEVTSDGDDDIVGYYVKRCDTWWGKEISHGEAGDTKILRLIKKGQGTWHGKVHEELTTIGDTKTFKTALLHYPHTTVADFINHVNFYSTLRAEELFEKKVKSNTFQIISFPLGKFLLNYILRLGFLDGAAGFVYAFMMSFHSFLVRSKLYQMQDQ
jgi:glycosyltransferase involved in cell wall biosynthesis